MRKTHGQRAPSRLVLSGLTSLCLLLSSTACATKIETISVPTPQAPPAQYLRDCVAEKVEVRVNADLVRQNLALKQALRLCNADKAALRAWAAAIEDGQTKDILEDMAESLETPSVAAGLRGVK